jgi:hypothetical protein
VALAFPVPVAHVSRVMIGSAPLSLGIGLLTTLLVALLAAFLAVICIGLPVALVLIVGLLAAMLLGWIATGSLIGERLVVLLGRPAPSRVMSAVLGTGLISVVALVPCVGALLAFLAQSWGVGAVVLTRFGTRPDFSWAVGLGQRLGVSHPKAGPAGDTTSGRASANDTKRLNAETGLSAVDDEWQAKP